MNYYETFSRSIFKLVIFAPLRFCIFALIFSSFTFAQTLAPGAPGKDAQWATAGKQGVGTAANLESKVWFTLAQGVMTEVYYPDVTVANVHLLQFLVVNGGGNTETERDDAIHEIKVLRNDALSFQQINTAKSGKWKITKTYTIDNERNTVLIDVKLELLGKLADNYAEFYVYYDPSLNNSGMHDTAWRQDGALLSQDGDKSSALVIQGRNENLASGFSNSVFGQPNNGFLGTSGGTDYIKRQFDDNSQHPSFGTLLRNYDRAENGNVTQTGEVVRWDKLINQNGKTQFTIALSFAKTPNEALQNAKSSLQKGFEKCLAEYEKGWSDYVKTLRKVEPKYQAQFNMAAMQLKAHEDKTIRGANIASLSVPWGGGDNANEANIGGYHLIWSRDLYQVATAFMALGDRQAAIRALDFLFKVQQKPDGSFPQNSYLDGKPFWGSLQLDEVAFPLILAYQLGRNDKATYENHVKRAADFIVKNGPVTPQERWEEEGGYSPSTIAAEIAGLVCAAEIARKNGDETSANLYLKTADEWQSNIEKWTVTKTGKYSKSPYYLRITQGKPDSGAKLELNNGAGFFDERDIVDAGFLELVRLGIKSPDDPIIQNSLKVIDEVIRVKTPNVDAFYRYNHDGYGEMDDGRRWNWDGKYTGKGRLWALLSGERGQYELARAYSYQVNAETKKADFTKLLTNANELKKARSRLDSMLAFANEGLMIPEQIWDKPTAPNADKQFVPELKFGEGTGSATPLAWSMAQFIRLAVNLQEGRNLDTPDIVYNRYVLGKKSEVNGQKIKESKDEITEIPLSFKIGVNDIDKFFGNSEVKNQKPYRVAKDCSSDFANSQSQTFPETVKQIIEDKEIVFWKCGEGKNVALIFYNEKAENVEIVGDFTNWKSDWKSEKLMFENYGSFFEKNLKYIPLEFSKNARVEYKLIVDGKWITDPLNPNKVDNGVGGENSFFTMPDYKATDWDKEFKGTPTFPSVSELEIESKKFGKRTVKIFVPSIYYKRSVLKKIPVLYLQDGSDYIARAKAVNILENLTAAKKIEPFMIVFVDPKDRRQEYWANDDFADFMALEVVPAVEKKYFATIKTGRENRALLGASLGGITSVHVALKYPKIFGRVGGQSSSFWVDNERVVKELEKLDGKTKFKFYFDDGTLEGVEDSRKVVKILKEKGFDVNYTEAEVGHNWTAWRDRLADAFIAIWK